jgi:hypothetical protein
MNSLSPPPDRGFPFTLLRERAADAHGNAVRETELDPATWIADDLDEARIFPDVVSLGRGRLTVLSTDERAFVQAKLMIEPLADGQYLRAALSMDDPGSPPPAMGDLVAVLLPAAGAVVYEILLAAADVEDALRSHPPEADSTVHLAIAAGQAVLQLRTDLGLIGDSADSEGPDAALQEVRHAQH